MRHWCSLLAASVFLIAGCAHETPRKSKASNTLPPLPWAVLQGKALLPGLAQLSAAQETRIVVRWKNDPSQDAAHYVTGIEKSLDLTTWERVGGLPYATQGSLVLTNTDPTAFFRVYNAIKR